VLLAVLIAVPAVMAQEGGGEDISLTEAVTGGDVSLNVRLRYEHADQDGLESSDAVTVRPRLGYATKPYKGVKAFVELEHVQPINDEDDFNQAGTNPGGAGKTVIADVEGAELNQAYLDIACPLTGGKVRAGRQRIILDNARFVGNVGWRQNEQTYDGATAVLAKEDHGTITYGYVNKVNRIFGEDNGTKPAGSAANASDFDGDVHLVNVSSDALPIGELTGYAYLLDLNNTNFAAGASSDTFGVRLTGSRETRRGHILKYEGEYARQTDNSGSPDGADFDTDYYLGKLAYDCGHGTLGVGYEVLGSDDGARGFGTPLATLHAHNGWADVFLATPADGLEDSFVFAGAMLPGGIKADVIYHEFASDEGSTDYGTEIDVKLVKKLTDNITVLAKYADYNADSDPGNPRAADVVKGSIEATLSF